MAPMADLYNLRPAATSSWPRAQRRIWVDFVVSVLKKKQICFVAKKKKPTTIWHRPYPALDAIPHVDA
jgi:hypothetical protein